MNERVNPFANVADAPIFEPKPKPEKPVPKETIDHIARGNNFPSRQAVKMVPEKTKKRRVYTTGRNRQFNIKATPETVDRCYRMADERKIPLRELLEEALDALERAGSPISVAGI